MGKDLKKVKAKRNEFPKLAVLGSAFVSPGLERQRFGLRVDDQPTVEPVTAAPRT
jgi:hypothetical protein